MDLEAHPDPSATYTETAAGTAAHSGNTLTLPPTGWGSVLSGRDTETPVTSGVTLLSDVLETLPRIRLASDSPDVAVIRLLGEGGMGRVELARQRALDREVAVKRLREDRSSVGATAALLQEGRLTGALEHPSIVPVHALGLDEEDQPVLVMKRVEGVSWRELIQHPNHPGWRSYSEDRLGRHLEILLQVCNGVHFAHSRGMFHLDLKTENVMVGSFGEVYVLDWGIAIRRDAPRSNAIAGTPAFMAPEMLDGTERVDVRTDVFLMGGMLYEALTGRTRHRGDSTREVLKAVSRCDPPELDEEVPTELADLCRRATALEPSDRPPDVLAFQRALLDYQRHRGSVSLSDQAFALCGELEAAIECLPAAPEPEQARANIRTLGTEARFGYRQALREWPDNPRATEGLDATLRIVTAFELSERNVFGATTLLQELIEPAPDLRARLAQLRQELEGDGRAQAELAQLRHETSAEVGLATRSWLMFGVHAPLGVFWMGMAAYGPPITHLGIMLFGVALLFGLVGSFWWFRDMLVSNQFNRRILFSLSAFCVYQIIQASIGIVRDVPVDHLAWGSYLGISLMFGVMGATLWPMVGLLVIPSLFAAVWLAFNPENVSESLALFNFGCAAMWLAPLFVERLRSSPDLGSDSH